MSYGTFQYGITQKTIINKGSLWVSDIRQLCGPDSKVDDDRESDLCRVPLIPIQLVYPDG